MNVFVSLLVLLVVVGSEVASQGKTGSDSDRLLNLKEGGGAGESPGSA
jgi:hypothetical protein